MNPIRLALMLVLSLVAGCDSGGGGGTAVSGAPAKLSGHVVGDDGPVTQARIEARDAANAVVAGAELNGNSQYALSIPAGTRYPLILTATPPTPEVPVLKAAVTGAEAREQDLSPVTTIVVDTALSLGGINDANLAKAAGAAIAQRKKSGGGSGAGATTQSFKGDPTKQYGGWH